MAVKLTDVAKHARVSVGTVSNVLNHPERVSPASRERVHSSIKELGYVRNLNASSLRSGVHRTVAMVVVDIGDPFFSLVAAHIEKELAARGLLFTLSSTNSDPDRTRTITESMATQSLRGIILMPTSLGVGEAQDLHDSGLPVILFDYPPISSSLSSVAADDVSGSRDAATLLLNLGHRNLGFVNGPAWATQTEARLQGFLEAVSMHPAADEISFEYVNAEEWTAAAGRAETELLMTGDGSRPTAIICGNDMLALGALSQLSRSGYAVPGEVSVVGFDDLPISEELPVPLTTVRRSARRMAEQTVELLLNDHHPESRMIGTHLIVRESTGPAPE